MVSARDTHRPRWMENPDSFGSHVPQNHDLRADGEDQIRVLMDAIRLRIIPPHVPLLRRLSFQSSSSLPKTLRVTTEATRMPLVAA